MGIEVSTYISGLTASWPPSGDPKSQGDDHLRLIKGVLQSTFPNASKAFYLPKGEAASGTLVLDATDQNNVLFITTTSADVAITLPSGFVSADAGWSCEIMKVSTDTNGVMVSPFSGSIVSQVGATATIRVGTYCQPARFVWTGASWICAKVGPPIGSTISFDGATAPVGYLVLDGSAYNTTTFAELFVAFGSGTLKDKRGRADIGSGTGSGLTARTLGTGYGVETIGLTATNIPSISSTNASVSISVTTTQNMLYGNAAQAFNTPGTGVQWYGFAPGALPSFGTVTSSGNNSVTVTSSGTNGTAFGLLQPSIATQKLIRAC